MRMRIAILLCGLGCGGCLPGFYTSRPEIRGTVVTASTGQPVSSAAVSVAKDEIGNPAVTVETNLRGEFCIPSATKFRVVWLMQDQGTWKYSVRAEAPGFMPTAVDLSDTGYMPSKQMDHVRLELVRSGN